MVIATNTFINVPVVLKYEDIPLIEFVREQPIGFATQVPIYHSDGTYLAKVKGNRVYPTGAGKKANVKVRNTADKFICTLENRVVFELSHGVGQAFKADAELFTPDGYFVRCADALYPGLFDSAGSAIALSGVTLMGNTFLNCRVGIWLRKDGSIHIGVS